MQWSTKTGQMLDGDCQERSEEGIKKSRKTTQGHLNVLVPGPNESEASTKQLQILIHLQIPGTRNLLMAPFNLDACIDQLLEKQLLHEALIREICEKAKEVLMRESNVVHVSAPVTVVGDIHGWAISTFSPTYLTLWFIKPVLWFNRNISYRWICAPHELSFPWSVLQRPNTYHYSNSSLLQEIM